MVSPRALTTAQTLLPCWKVATMRRATLPMRAASATDVPPYFWTTTDKVNLRKRRQMSLPNDAGARPCGPGGRRPGPPRGRLPPQAPGLGAMRGSVRLCALAACMASTLALTAGDASDVSK